MDEELTALASAGAATLVTAMATDLWQDTRSAVLALFRRATGRRRAALEAQLDNNASLLRQSADPTDTADAPEGTAEVQHALRGLWARELGALLRQDPECREPLARLVREARAALAVDGRPGPIAQDHPQQHNTAHDSGSVFAVQGGVQPVYWLGTQQAATEE